MAWLLLLRKLIYYYWCKYFWLNGRSNIPTKEGIRSDNLLARYINTLFLGFIISKKTRRGCILNFQLEEKIFLAQFNKTQEESIYLINKWSNLNSPLMTTSKPFIGPCELRLAVKKKGYLLFHGIHGHCFPVNTFGHFDCSDCWSPGTRGCDETFKSNLF